MIHALLFALPLLFAAQPIQSTRPAPAAPAAQLAGNVSLRIYPNAACPIMGKPVSTALYADTEMGRIFVCCKSCVKDILADVPVAYRSAYPSDQKLDNLRCPVTGLPIAKDSPRVVLQGFSFLVHGPEDVAKARENSQIVLAKLHDETLVDLDNHSCPVTGEPVARNAFVVIDGTLVHLSNARLVAEVAKAPALVLKKAREIRASESQPAGGGARPTPAKGG